MDNSGIYHAKGINLKEMPLDQLMQLYKNLTYPYKFPTVNDLTANTSGQTLIRMRTLDSIYEVACEIQERIHTQAQTGTIVFSQNDLQLLYYFSEKSKSFFDQLPQGKYSDKLKRVIHKVLYFAVDLRHDIEVSLFTQFENEYKKSEYHAKYLKEKANL